MKKLLIAFFLAPLGAWGNQIYPDCDEYLGSRTVINSYLQEKIGHPDNNSLPPEELLTNPRGSACWLIVNIKQVGAEKVTPNDHSTSYKTVLALRALRYITNCKDFVGSMVSTQTIDPKNIRWQLLLKGGVGSVPFFRTWMARDMIFFAPKEVQSEIIEAWLSWYQTSSKTFEFKKCESIDNWYF